MGHEIIIIAVLVLIAGPVIYFISQNASKSRRNSQQEFLASRGITPTVEYTYTTVLGGKYVNFVVDEDNQRVCLCTKQSTLDILAFSDILGAEICADNQVIDGFGDTLTGGIIAGSVGAIIGAMSSSSAICSYKVIIYTKQISSPKRVITLIDSKTSKDSMDYLNAVSFADSVIATIKAIVSLNTTNQ